MHIFSKISNDTVVRAGQGLKELEHLGLVFFQMGPRQLTFIGVCDTHRPSKK